MRLPLTKRRPGVLFVCRANLCRSPMAEGLLRRELELRGLHKTFCVGSAGTHVARNGQPPDARAVAVLAKHGVNISRSKASRLPRKAFQRFDHIIAMEQRNLEWLQQQIPDESVAQLSLLLGWAGQADSDIPDPYFGSSHTFEDVFRLLRAPVTAIADKLSLEQR